MATDPILSLSPGSVQVQLCTSYICSNDVHSLLLEFPAKRNLTTKNRNVKISGLKKWQNYTLSVAAVTGAGHGVRQGGTLSVVAAVTMYPLTDAAVTGAGQGVRYTLSCYNCHRNFVHSQLLQLSQELCTLSVLQLSQELCTLSVLQLSQELCTLSVLKLTQELCTLSVFQLPQVLFTLSFLQLSQEL